MKAQKFHLLRVHDRSTLEQSFVSAHNCSKYSIVLFLSLSPSVSLSFFLVVDLNC